MNIPHIFLWITVLAFGVYAYFTKNNKNRLFMIFVLFALIILRFIFFGNDARHLAHSNQLTEIEFKIYYQGVSDMLSIFNGEIIHFIGIFVVIFILCVRKDKHTENNQEKTEVEKD